MLPSKINLMASVCWNSQCNLIVNELELSFAMLTGSLQKKQSWNLYSFHVSQSMFLHLLQQSLKNNFRIRGYSYWGLWEALWLMLLQLYQVQPENINRSNETAVTWVAAQTPIHFAIWFSNPLIYTNQGTKFQWLTFYYSHL